MNFCTIFKFFKFHLYNFLNKYCSYIFMKENVQFSFICFGLCKRSVYFLNRYRSMKKIIRDLRQGRSAPRVPSQDSPPPSPDVLNLPEIPERTTENPLQRQGTKPSCRFPWKPPLQVHYIFILKCDLTDLYSVQTM